MNSIKEIEEEVIHCLKCELFRFRLNSVPGEIFENTDIVFIDGSPRIDEDITGKPMGGSIGKQFRQTIYDNIGLEYGQYSIIHFVKCLLKYKKFEIQERPKQESAFWCSEYIYSQLSILKPRLLVILGFLPFDLMLRNQDNFEFRKKLKIPVSDFYGKIFEVKSLLNDDKWPAIIFPSVWDFKKIKQKEKIKNLCKKTKDLNDKLRAGEDISDLFSSISEIQ